jgi:CheY-like chemotaxis protein
MIKERAYAVRESVIRLAPPRIVIADDDGDLRKMLAAALRADGYGVLEARNGLELLDVVNSAVLFGALDCIDLIITDVRMPGYSGLEILAGLREGSFQIPVVLITAYCDFATRQTAQRLAAEAIFQKPFDVDALRLAVQSIAPTDLPEWGAIERG